MKSFLNYYQEELLSFRKQGGAFAKKYPEIAEAIDLKDGQSMDPHTERLIEAVAFMSAKLQRRIDENSGNIAFHILNAVYPNLVNLFPPCSVVRFFSDTEGEPTEKILIPRETYFSTISKNKSTCFFRTLYPLEILPLTISSIALQKQGRKIGGDDLFCLEISLKTNAGPVEGIGINSILLHINSNIIEDALLIYESIFSNPYAPVFVKINEKIIKLPDGSLIPWGFKDQDTVCPVSNYSINSFQLFQEMLHFKRKFMFFSIENLGKAIMNSGEENINEFSILLDVRIANERLFQVVKNDSLLLNCLPVANLFKRTSDPLRFTGTKNKYLLLADQLKDKEIEIHSVSEVHLIDNETSEDSVVQPYFALAIDADSNIEHELFWVINKESSDIRGLPGNDFYLSFIETNLDPSKVYDDVVYAKLLCTNRFEARDIPVFARMDVEGLETAGMFGKLLYKTTPTVNFSDDSTTLWGLVAQLSSTHLAYSKEGALLDALKKLLEIFSAGLPLRVEQLSGTITKVEVKQIVKRFGQEAWRGFVRGLEFDFYLSDHSRSYFPFFFLSVVNQYLSSCVTLNSFVQLHLVLEKTNVKKDSWKPTSGRKELA